MLELNTLYLLLAMGGFVLVAVVLVHQHNCADTVRKKRNEVQGVTLRLEQKIAVIEQEVVDLQMKIDDLDEQISTVEGQEES